MAREGYQKKAQDILAQAEVIRDPGERACRVAIASAYFQLADLFGVRPERGTSHRTTGDQRRASDS
jgi:hypothetical protein